MNVHFSRNSVDSKEENLWSEKEWWHNGLLVVSVCFPSVDPRFRLDNSSNRAFGVPVFAIVETSCLRHAHSLVNCTTKQFTIISPIIITIIMGWHMHTRMHIHFMSIVKVMGSWERVKTTILYFLESLQSMSIDLEL